MSWPMNEPLLGEALLDTVKHFPGDIELIELIIQRGGDVCDQNGLIISTALKKCPLDVFKTLAGNIENRSVLVGQLLSEALLVHDSRARILLDRGCSESSLDEALVLESHHRPFRHDTLELLLEFGARVDCGDGIALQRACSAGDERAVSLMLKTSLSQHTLAQSIRRTVDEGSAHCLQIMKLLLSSTTIDRLLLHRSLTAVTEKVSEADFSRQYQCLISLIASRNLSKRTTAPLFSSFC